MGKYVWFATSIICLTAFTVATFLQHYILSGISLILFFLFLAVAMRRRAVLKPYAFSIFIFAAVTASMYFPSYFLSLGDLDLQQLIVPILMIIMFGMGTRMNISDFKGILQMPMGVLIGLMCQFTIMPLVGFGLANSFGFSPEIASGILLVGCSPSGLASNVMSFIAKANLALSLTLTIVATLLSPLVTPALMQLLASQYVPIDFLAMMWSITKIVMLPVIGGLFYNHYFHGKIIWLDKAMPTLSMVGIALVITIITASGRDALLSIGFLLILVILLHNSIGYFLGFWVGRLAGLDIKSSRTIAFEVGMQNSGLASGIALEMGRVATMGLAPAVFGPLMNITGSSLAAFWRRNSVDFSTATDTP